MTSRNPYGSGQTPYGYGPGEDSATILFIITDLSVASTGPLTDPDRIGGDDTEQDVLHPGKALFLFARKHVADSHRV